MGRSAATTAAPSAPRRRKATPSSSTATSLPEGMTPRPPRRRKQPTTAKTPSRLSTMMADDEEYSFADNRSLDDSNSQGSGEASRGSSSGSSKSSTRSKSSGKSSSSNSSSRAKKVAVAGEKENLINENTTASSNSRLKAVAESPNIAARKKRGAGVSNSRKKNDNNDPMEELNASMANINLGNTLKTQDNHTTQSITNALPHYTNDDYKVSPFPPPGYGTKSIKASTTKDGNAKYTLKSAIQTIQDSGNKDYDSICKPFSSSLSEAVSSSSYTACGGGGSSNSILLLEENVSKLIDTTKRCLKSLSTSSSSSSKKKDTDAMLELALLRVAIYSLRSIVPLVVEGNSGDKKSSSTTTCRQVAIKLFYHCVVLAGDACHRAFQSFTNCDSSNKKQMGGSDNEGVQVMEYAMLCLGAYEGLGQCLLQKKVSKSSKKSSNTACWEEMLPLPDEKAASSSKKKGILPHRQLVKIAMESSLCAASSFLYMSLMALHKGPSEKKRSWTLPNDFHFVSNVILETCLGEECPEEGTGPTFQRIMFNVAMPYVMQSLFLSAEGGEDGMTDVLNTDSVRHVKKAFRILWDGSKCLEDIAGSVEDSSALRICCLELQNHAIQFITQCLKGVFEQCAKLTSSGVKELAALFERASSSALKSVGMFEKAASIFTTTKEMMQSKKGALLHFHGRVGDELNGVATCLNSANSTGERKKRMALPAPYYEFCVYRSIHQWRLLGLAMEYGGPLSLSFDKGSKIKSEEMESVIAMATFSIVELVLHARHNLNVNATQRVEETISFFKDAVMNTAPPESLGRCRSMLMMLDLQRYATKMITSSEPLNNGGEGTSFSVLASVLGHCLAPLEVKMTRTTKDPQRSLTFRLSAADLYAKSAAFFDISGEESMSQADKQLRKAFEVLLNELGRLETSQVNRKTSTIMAIESFAKTATTMGKRRSERKDPLASLRPQILVVELLSKVAIKATNKDLFSAYQMPNRYMALSSQLESTGCVAESCAAVAMAAWCSIETMADKSNSDNGEEDEEEGDSASEEILLFPENKFQGLSCQGGGELTGLSPIIRRLILCYLKCKGLATDKMPLHTTTDMMLKHTVMGKVLEAACSSSGSSSDNLVGTIRLSKLLHCSVWNQKRYEEELSTARIADIIREVMRSTIKVARSNGDHNNSETSSLHILEELKTFLQAQRKRLGDFIDPELLQVLSSSFHVAFAAHLVDSRILYFPRLTSWSSGDSRVNSDQIKLLVHSCLQLEQAEKHFSAASSNESSICDVCFYAQWAAVQLHQAILHEHVTLAKTSSTEACEIDATSRLSVWMKYASALSTVSNAMAQINESEEELFSAVVESLLSTLKRLLCWFSCHSDAISATKCFILLRDVFDLLEQQQCYLGSLSSYLSISARFGDLARSLARYNISPDESSCFTSESGLQDISAAIKTTFDVIENAAPTPELDKLLHKLLANIEDEAEVLLESSDDEDRDLDNCSETDLMTQKQWLLTTMLTLLANMYLNAGYSASAVKYLNWCRIQCKQFSRYLRSATCHFNSVSLDDISIQVDCLLTKCYEDMAQAFCQLGLRRKAEDHAMLAVIKSRVLTTSGFNQVSMKDLVESVELYDGQESFVRPIRSLMRVKALSTSVDKMESQDSLAENIGHIAIPHTDNRIACINQLLCESENLLAYDDSLRHVRLFSEKAQLYIDHAYRQLKQVGECVDTLVPLQVFTRRAGTELKLRVFREPVSRLLGPDPIDDSTAASINELIDLKFGAGICNAEAYYRLGLIALRKAKMNGELQILWKGHAVPAEEDIDSNFGEFDSKTLPHTYEAKTLLQNALANAPPASFHQTKNIMRYLALVIGPREGQNKPGLMAASLINMSVGGSARNIVRDSLQEGIVRDCFQAFDDESLDHNARAENVGMMLLNSASSLPTNWNISTIATCPTGETLVSSLRVSAKICGEKVVNISTSCIFSSSNEAERGVHDDALSPLDSIIERSQRQLHGINEEVAKELDDAESSRRKWWKRRHSTDEDLQSLLKHTESKYFGRDPIRQRIVPDELFAAEKQRDSCFDDDNSDCSELGPGNLESRFEAVEGELSEPTPRRLEFDIEAERSNLTKLTVALLKKQLDSIGVGGKSIKKMRKADLIDLLLSEMESNFNSEMEQASPSAIEDPNNSSAEEIESYPQRVAYEVEEAPAEVSCVLLVLDEHWLRFPIESMDLLANIPLTRIPSLPFALATLLETETLHSTIHSMIDTRKVKYVVDPESNLSQSASTLGPALNSLALKNGCKWEGVIGQMPSSEFMTQALSEENGLYLYCGHGGGEKAFSRSQVQELMIVKDNGVRGCRSPIVLMGCSSGKLQSVNRPKENPSGHMHVLHYEPEGIALTYLLAGAPCVVGNLWDVTDRDIDRYCITLMEDFIQSEDIAPRKYPSLAKCVSDARRACKLRYIVGSAPVCYGVPVYNARRTMEDISCRK